MPLDLFASKFLAVDGVKFKAVNSKARNLNQKTLALRLEKIRESGIKIPKELEETDEKEENIAAYRLHRRKSQETNEQKEDHSELLKALKQSIVRKLQPIQTIDS